ncbi:MAG: hypothetical protein V3S66_06740, partial [Desulfobacterales bacterium]
ACVAAGLGEGVVVAAGLGWLLSKKDWASLAFGLISGIESIKQMAIVKIADLSGQYFIHFAIMTVSFNGA